MKLKDSDEIVKVFIETEKYNILSRKKDKGRRSDGLLEHIGGHIKIGESPFEALLRESKEEEKTGLLYLELKKSDIKPEEIFVPVKNKIEKHYIYNITISREVANSLKMQEKESYGIEFVESSLIKKEKNISKIKDQLTWKTKAIYKAMGLKI